MTGKETPLAGPPPAEVPLASAPLVRVVAQVRFPLVASVERREFIGSFQEAIRGEYPILRPEQSRNVALGQHGVIDARESIVWRFLDTRGEWCVTLTSDFLALETSRYGSRDDFLARFTRILESLVTHVDPRVIDRLGVRYIDRVTGDDLTDLALLVRPEVCGVLSTGLSTDVRYSISESVFDLPDSTGQLKTRWGLIPAGGTADPSTIQEIDEPSWLLDVDAFRVETRDLDVGEVIQETRAFAERIYSVFRWAVTDEFLRRYGGEA